MADPDLQIRGVPGHPDPDIRGEGTRRKKKKIGSALRASLWSKIRAPGPSPGSATVLSMFYIQKM